MALTKTPGCRQGASRTCLSNSFETAAQVSVQRRCRWCTSTISYSELLASLLHKSVDRGDDLAYIRRPVKAKYKILADEMGAAKDEQQEK